MWNELTDEELELVRKALRMRMDTMMRTMKHIRGEYSKEYYAEYEAVRKLYHRMGGKT